VKATVSTVKARPHAHLSPLVGWLRKVVAG